MKSSAVVLLFTLILLLPGCSTVELSTRSLDVPVSFSGNVNKKFVVVKHFRREAKAWFVFFNIVTISEPEVGAIIKEEMLSALGDAVANVSIQGQTSLSDGGVSLLVSAIGLAVAPPLGFAAGYIVGARTYTIEGDIIRYTE